MKITRFFTNCIQSKLGYEYLKLFWKLAFSYEKIHIEKEVKDYLMYKYWKPEEKEKCQDILEFTVKKCQENFGKDTLKLQDKMSWELYTDYLLTEMLYKKFGERLPHIYTISKGRWHFAKSVTVSADGTSICIETVNSKINMTIRNSLTINGKEIKTAIDDWTCFKLIAQGHKELAA